MLKDALDYCGRGWSVFPLQGKSPRVAWRPLCEAAAARGQVEAWWKDWPDAGIGLVLGSVSGATRLDADGPASLVALADAYGEMPSTPRFRTPAGGVGWLFAYNGERTEVLWRGQGAHEEVRFMSDGTYTVLPPSPHPDGGNYEWELHPNDAPLAPLPDRLLAALRSAAAGRVVRELEQELRGTVPKPERAVLVEALHHLPAEMRDDYDGWLRVGMALHSAYDDLLDEWDAWSRKSVKYEADACSRKWATFRSDGGTTGRSVVFWAAKSGWSPPDDAPWTDLGNAKRLTKRCSSSMRYCHPWTRWLVWDGARWAPDESGSALREAMAASDELLAAAKAAYMDAIEAAQRSDSNDAHGRKVRASKWFAFAMKSQDFRRIDAALALTRSYLPVQPEELDTDKWALNCLNGTLDLRTMELRPHRREDYLTKLCPHEYDPRAEAPRWGQFVDEVFAGRARLVSWFRRLLGYCLTGSTAEHVLPILWGCGANGKSTLITAAMHALGPDYSDKAPRELLLAQRTSGHPTMLASLFGKRLVAAVETGDAHRIDEVAVKELTGDDSIVCRRLYEDFWTFRPTHKLLLATNHRPEVRGTDHAIWRRLKMVPFTVVFDGASQDKELSDKLAAEAQGILRWMVEGCAEWQERGLGEPEEVKEATGGYRAEQDRFAEFLDCCYERKEGYRTKIADINSRYTAWCQLNREYRLTGQAFGRAMTDKGFLRDASRKYYLGIAEKQQEGSP